MLTYEYQTFLRQIDLDTKIKNLLNAIHDAFDFAQEASPLRDIMQASRQANILVLMLGHVGNCCDFILSYADKNFCTPSFSILLAIVNIPFAGMRFMKNAGSQADKQISDLCSTFDELRQKFLDHTSLTAGISVFQILDDVGVLSAQVTGISTRLDKMTTQLSNQILDLGMMFGLSKLSSI